MVGSGIKVVSRTVSAKNLNSGLKEMENKQ
jgi:hypothetical protein